MNETMFDSIEPITLELKKDFSPDYLSGFYAENLDSVQSDKTKHVLKRTEKTIEDEIFNTLIHYDEVSMESFKAEITQESVKYTLLPVWFLTTRFQDEEYVFAMNGTSGKLIGDLPFDKTLYNKYLLIRVSIITAIIYTLFTIIQEAAMNKKTTLLTILITLLFITVSASNNYMISGEALSNDEIVEINDHLNTFKDKNNIYLYFDVNAQSNNPDFDALNQNDHTTLISIKTQDNAWVFMASKELSSKYSRRKQ